jgi:hypothetical protein
LDRHLPTTLLARPAGSKTTHQVLNEVRRLLDPRCDQLGAGVSLLERLEQAVNSTRRGQPAWRFGTSRR